MNDKVENDLGLVMNVRTEKRGRVKGRKKHKKGARLRSRTDSYKMRNVMKGFYRIASGKEGQISSITCRTRPWEELTT